MSSTQEAGPTDDEWKPFPAARSLRILLIEDNPGDVELVRLALRAHHIQHDLQLAKDGAEALTYIGRMGQSDATPRPDCVILDLNLPHADGLDLILLLRQDPACAETPIIVFSSSNDWKDRRRAQESGATRYFRKPADLTEYLTLGELIGEIVREFHLARYD